MACVLSPSFDEEDTTKTTNLTVMDVYDIATAIGNDFERLIDQYGAEPMSSLVPQVINVLEKLEQMAVRNEKEQEENAELRYSLRKLENEKKCKAEERAKYEKELEAIEESWRLETKELVSTVEKLREDNKKLLLQISNNQQNPNNIDLSLTDKSIEETLLKKLTETIEKQREEIRQLHKELKEKKIDCETIQMQFERTARLNSDYKRRNSLTQKKAHSLLAEKADLQALLHDKEQQINVIKDRLQHESCDSLPSPERNELKTKLIDVEEELLHYRQPISSTYSEEDVLPVHGPINREPDEKLYPNRSESGIRKLLKRFIDKL